MGSSAEELTAAEAIASDIVVAARPPPVKPAGKCVGASAARRASASLSARIASSEGHMGTRNRGFSRRAVVQRQSHLIT